MAGLLGHLGVLVVLTVVQLEFRLVVGNVRLIIVLVSQLSNSPVLNHVRLGQSGANGLSVMSPVVKVTKPVIVHVLF